MAVYLFLFSVSRSVALSPAAVGGASASAAAAAAAAAATVVLVVVGLSLFSSRPSFAILAPCPLRRSFRFGKGAHWSVICQAMEGHVRRALSSGWSLPSLKDLHDPDMGMKVLRRSAEQCEILSLYLCWCDVKVRCGGGAATVVVNLVDGNGVTAVGRR